MRSETRFGGGGSGVRGGGHVVEAGGSLELLDLSARASCDWRSGDAILAETPELSRVLARLARLDWYFALELEREIRFLDFCFTGPLYLVSPRDRRSPVRPPQGRIEQVGFRLDAVVYLDAALYFRLEPRSRALLMLHETLHSYIGMGEQMRNLKLRSMVRAIDQVDRGQLVSRRELHDRMRVNAIDFPTEVTRLDPYRSQVEFLLAPVEVRRAWLVGAEDPESRLLSDLRELARVRAWLARWDRAAIADRWPEDFLAEAVASVALYGTAAELRAVLGNPRFRRLNPALAVLESIDELDADRREALFDSPAFARVFGDIYAELEKANVTLGEGRAMADPRLQALACGTPADSNRPLTSLRPRSSDCRPAGQAQVVPAIERLPSGLRGFAVLVARLARQGEWARIEREVGASERFYAALGLAPARAALASLPLPVARERAVAEGMLAEISAGLLGDTLEAIRDRLEPEEYRRLVDLIRLDRLPRQPERP